MRRAPTTLAAALAVVLGCAASPAQPPAQARLDWRTRIEPRQLDLGPPPEVGDCVRHRETHSYMQLVRDRVNDAVDLPPDSVVVARMTLALDGSIAKAEVVRSSRDEHAEAFLRGLRSVMGPELDARLRIERNGALSDLEALWVPESPRARLVVEGVRAASPFPPMSDSVACLARIPLLLRVASPPAPQPKP